MCNIAATRHSRRNQGIKGARVATSGDRMSSTQKPADSQEQNNDFAFIAPEAWAVCLKAGMENPRAFRDLLEYSTDIVADSNDVVRLVISLENPRIEFVLRDGIPRVQGIDQGESWEIAVEVSYDIVSEIIDEVWEETMLMAVFHLIQGK